MDVNQLATCFLVGHLIAVTMTVWVLVRQVKIFREFRDRPDSTLQVGRIILLVLAIATCLGNLPPILIDSAVLAGLVPRARPTTFGIIYGLSNLLILTCQAAALLALYIIAEKVVAKARLQSLMQESPVVEDDIVRP